MYVKVISILFFNFTRSITENNSEFFYLLVYVCSQTATQLTVPFFHHHLHTMWLNKVDSGSEIGFQVIQVHCREFIDGMVMDGIRVDFCSVSL